MRIQNLVKFVIPATLFGACATGGASTDRAAAAPASPEGPVAATLPGHVIAAIDHPRLPSADDEAVEIRTEAGDEATATIRLCVARNGDVERVDLVHPSSSTTYDRALVKDVADWQFGGGTWNPTGLDTCELATISYHPQV